MRVVQVVGTFAPEHCGVAHYTARLADELTTRGIDIAIASGLASAPARVPLLAIRSFPRHLTGLVDLLLVARRWRADWLHLQYAPGSFDRSRVITWLPVLGRLVPGGPRLAVTAHEYGGWPVQTLPWLRPAVDRLLRAGERRGWLECEALALLGFSDRAIVTNPDHLAAVRTRSPRLAERLTLIPLGPNVDPAIVDGETRATARRQLGVPDAFIVMFFGFVHPVKGVETLLAAWRRFGAAWPTASLWIVGGVHSLALRGAEADAYATQVRQLVADLGLGGRVELTGFLPDVQVARRLRAADLVALPFNRGATLKSGALVTSLCFGLPLVTTAGGDLGELRHGESLWLVPPRDPAALAVALETLATDAALRCRLGQAAARRAVRYRWATIAEQHLELYAGRATCRPAAEVPRRAAASAASRSDTPAT